MKKKWADCAPITKNFYEEDPIITNMSEEEVASFRKSQNNIKVDFMFTDETSHDNQIPNPVKTFEQAFRVSLMIIFVCIFDKYTRCLFFKY